MPYTRIAVEGAECPHCGGQIYKSDRFISCENSGREEGMCQFFTGLILANGSEINDDDIRALCRGELVGPFEFHSDKKNKNYSASLQASVDTGKVELIFPNSGTSRPAPVETSLCCPDCGTKLLRRSGQYGEYLACPNCEFRLNRLAFGEHNFTEAELKKLLNGEETEEIEGLISKKGKTYSAKFRIDPDTGRIAPVFD